VGSSSRRLLAVVVPAVVAGTLVLTGVTPAAAAGTAVRPSSWASVDSQSPRTVAVDSTGDARLGTWRDGRGRRHTARAYFTYDIGNLSGATVSAAVLSLRQTAVRDCRREPAVEVWRTAPVTSAASWRKQPADVQRLTTLAGGGSGLCPTAVQQFDVAAAVRGALADGLQTLTLSVRLPAGAERDPRRHLRIANDPELAVDADEPGVPIIDGEASGLDLPHQITLRPGGPGVVRWTWKLMNTEDEEPEVHVVPAAADGTAVITVTLTKPGLYYFSVSAHQADGSAAETSTYFEASSLPKVTSELYVDAPEEVGGVGVTDRFTFRPNSPDITAYRYAFNSEPAQQVDAVNGAGTVSWAPSRPGTNSLTITGLTSLGKESQTGTYIFFVAGPTPRVTSSEYPGWGVHGGRLTPGVFEFQPGVAGVTSYVYRLNNATEQTVAADDNGQASVELTPGRSGRHELMVRSRTASGALSAPTTYEFLVANHPDVTGSLYQFDGSAAGRPGLEGTFVLSADPVELPGVVQYSWSVDGQQFSAEPGPDGTATVSYVPQRAGFHRLRVSALLADGRWSDPFEGEFGVSDPSPSVSSDVYSEWSEAGGVDEPGQFWLSSGVAGVAEYRYRLNNGPEQVVPAENGSATVTLAPDRAGENVLTVEARWPDGRTATTSWTFLVAQVGA
jgi:hypothetical protein